MRSITIRSVALAAFLPAIAGTARAQDGRFNLFALGGGYSATSDLSRLAPADFKLGFNLGGGVAMQMAEGAEVQVSLRGAQSHLRRGGVETGIYLNRYYLGGDLKASRAFRGLTGFFMLGGGAVFLHEKGDGDKTQGFAHAGAGVAYPLRAGVSMFVQLDVFGYGLSGLREGQLGVYRSAQWDLGWSVGASYKLPI